MRQQGNPEKRKLRTAWLGGAAAAVLCLLGPSCGRTPAAQPEKERAAGRPPPTRTGHGSQDPAPGAWPAKARSRDARTSHGPLDVPALSKEERSVFWGSAEDRRPRIRADRAHYWVGNEWEHFVYYPDLKESGGGYVGVGSDQGYLFAGWMRARFAWLADYDDAVVATHWVYRAFFLSAETADRFVDLWSKKSIRTSLDLLASTYAGNPRLEFYKDVFTRARRRVSRRLRGVRGRMRKRKVPSFLTDARQYAYVRNLVRSGRVRPMLVNLLEPRGLVAIGQTARKLNVVIRALYLSNAEEHWRKYTRTFRKNILSLPFDRRSVVLRTTSINPEQSAYNYQVQPALNFAAWIADRRVRRVSYITRREVHRARGVKFFIADHKPPDPARRKRRKRSARPTTPTR